MNWADSLALPDHASAVKLKVISWFSRVELLAPSITLLIRYIIAEVEIVLSLEFIRETVVFWY